MPHADEKLEKLRQKARTDGKHKGTLADKLSYQQARKDKRIDPNLEVAEQITKDIIWLLKYRNLTLREATTLYRAGRDIELLHPSITDPITGQRIRLDNYKEQTVAYYTRCHNDCPCCGQELGGNSVWFIRPYFIPYGMLRVCRKCNSKWKQSDNCIAVYYRDFISLVDRLGNDVAWKVYKPYLQLGLVHSVTSINDVTRAREYMQHVISQIKPD